MQERIGHDAIDARISTERNSCIVHVKLSCDEGAIEAGDRIRLRSSVSQKGEVVHERTLETELDERVLQDGLDFDLDAYGEHALDIEVLRGRSAVWGLSRSVAAVADHYDIVYLFSPHSFLLFTLLLCEDETLGSKGPILISRNAGFQWAWKQPPERGAYGIHGIPSADVGFRDTLDAYLGELLRLSPDSTFTFYLTDTNSFLIMRLIDAKRIKPSAYRVMLLEEGMGTLAMCGWHYSRPGGPWLRSLYQTAKLLVERILTRLAGRVVFDSDNWGWGTHFIWPFAASDPSVSWVVSDSDELVKRFSDKLFKRFIGSHPRILRLDCKELIRRSLEGDGQIERLLGEAPGFDPDDVLIMGTIPRYSSFLDEYLRFTLAWYGPDRRYLYKAHPRHLLEDRPDFPDLLRELGIGECDSLLPTELILAKNAPGIIAGYPSTVDNSLPAGIERSLYWGEQSPSSDAQIAKSSFYIEPIGEDSPEVARQMRDEGRASLIARISEKGACLHDCAWALWSESEGLARLYTQDWQPTGEELAFRPAQAAAEAMQQDG